MQRPYVVELRASILDFFGARAIHGVKKVSDPFKSLNFLPGPFRILEMAPFIDFQGLIS